MPNNFATTAAHGFRQRGGNAFANGANQNCGNVITDRPSSRVTQAPGGGSSFGTGLSFGGDDATPYNCAAKVRGGTKDPNACSDQNISHGFRQRGGNAFANGANQNCGNQITDRPSSRVTQAPGGGSSFGTGLGFGGDDALPSTTRRGAMQNHNARSEEKVAHSKKKQGAHHTNARSDQTAHGFRNRGSNAFANGAHQNCGNQITDRPSSRVTQAPGGSSSFGSGLGFGGDASVPKLLARRDPNARSEEHSQLVSHGFRNRGGNAFANGAHQNCGNQITDRPSSRVTQAPGGSSSFGTGLAF